MPNKNIYSKKILLIIVVFFCFTLFSNISFSTLIEDKKNSLNMKMNTIFKKLDSRSFTKQTQFYKIFKKIAWEKKITIKDKNKLTLISYIESKFDFKYIEYKKLSTEGFSPLYVSKHKTLILKFTRWGNHRYLINLNKEKIKSRWSVFLFKQWSDLSRKDINFITSEIKKLNKNILIFIDQEGGWINRYIEFEKRADINKYFSYCIIDKKIRTIFPSKYWYFPSLKRIWTFYDELSPLLTSHQGRGITQSEQDYFLEKIAYIRLQTLKDNWINTYWLVLDLDRWNPVISWYSRSFSKHLDKYKLLVDAFAKASKQTWVTLYFKHFPGHWAGKTDSHKWVLNLAWQEKYLQENLELFNYALNNNPHAWIMVAHAYLPNSTLSQFNKWINKASFLLTDDLWMQWYKLSHWRNLKNMFFSTDAILKSNKLITVDSINVSWVK